MLLFLLGVAFGCQTTQNCYFCLQQGCELVIMETGEQFCVPSAEDLDDVKLVVDHPRLCSLVRQIVLDDHQEKNKVITTPQTHPEKTKVIVTAFPFEQKTPPFTSTVPIQTSTSAAPSVSRVIKECLISWSCNSCVLAHCDYVVFENNERACVAFSEQLDNVKLVVDHARICEKMRQQIGFNIVENQADAERSSTGNEQEISSRVNVTPRIVNDDKSLSKEQINRYGQTTQLYPTTTLLVTTTSPKYEEEKVLATDFFVSSQLPVPTQSATTTVNPMQENTFRIKSPSTFTQVYGREKTLQTESSSSPVLITATTIMPVERNTFPTTYNSGRQDFDASYYSTSTPKYEGEKALSTDSRSSTFPDPVIITATTTMPLDDYTFPMPHNSSQQNAEALSASTTTKENDTDGMSTDARRKMLLSTNTTTELPSQATPFPGGYLPHMEKDPFSGAWVFMFKDVLTLFDRRRSFTEEKCPLVSYTKI